jgi:hypothetical protein
MPKRLINEKAKIDPANKAMVLDQWMTPPCAVEALIALEREHLPPIILEPCCGDGTGFVEPLRKAGYEVVARDIDPDFGFPVADFLNDPLPEGWPFAGAVGIVSNPPFTLAEQFVRKAIAAGPYSAWLLRLNWLEGCARKRSSTSSRPPAFGSRLVGCRFIGSVTRDQRRPAMWRTRSSFGIERRRTPCPRSLGSISERCSPNPQTHGEPHKWSGLIGARRPEASLRRNAKRAARQRKPARLTSHPLPV